MTCGMTRRALLLVIGGFLCCFKLSADVYLYRMSISDTRIGGSSFDVVQKELFGASLLLVQGTHKTASYLRALSHTAQTDHNNIFLDGSANANATNSSYAYAFVIGGVNPSRPSYKGFLYTILVSARILRHFGSTADVVGFFQLSYAYKGSDSLPDEDLRALRGLGIKIYYIERSEHESFYETVLNKFKILQLTHYRRVLLMDGDVMPVTNLDYLFELSDDNKHGPGNSTLRENIVVSGLWEPSNAGFFMLTPSLGDYDKIQEVIQKRYQQAKVDGVLFDEVKGWGHVIEEGDEWVSRRESGRNWTFHFAFSDQGLLYHWTKYVKHSVTIVYEDMAENWSPIDTNGVIKAVKERVLIKPFVNYSNLVLKQHSSCKKFMCDFMHFSGADKPWLKKPPIALDDSNKLDSGNNFWWYFLMLVDHELGLKLDFDNWKEGQRPSLGMYATWGDMGKHNKKTAALGEAAEAESEKQFKVQLQETGQDDTFLEDERRRFTLPVSLKASVN